MNYLIRINTVNEMKLEKLELTKKLDSRDQEIAIVKQQLQVLQGERSQIEQRVTSLLSSIDNWEKLNDTPDVVVESKSGEGNTLF